MIIDGFPFCIQLASSADAGMASLKDLLSGLIGAVLGGLIGVISSYYAVERQSKIARTMENERNENELEGVIQSIYDEIDTIYEGYLLSAGIVVQQLKPEEPLTNKYIVGDGYFTMYNANASAIGRIQDRQLRRLIVNTYTKGRMLLDSFRLNNEILSRYEQNMWLFYKNKDEYYRTLANFEHTRLVLNVAIIQGRHAETTENVSKLLQYIDQRKSKAD